MWDALFYLGVASGAAGLVGAAFVIVVWIVAHTNK